MIMLLNVYCVVKVILICLMYHSICLLYSKKRVEDDSLIPAYNEQPHLLFLLPEANY